MNKYYILICVIVFAHLLPSNAFTDESKHQTIPAPMALKYFTQLNGEWVGTHINHQGKEVPMTLIYRTVAGGTAVEERSFPDTPQEMITVYHGDSDGGMLMTHYCMLGNQPRMKLENTHENVFKFSYLDGVNIDRNKTGHMGGLKLTIIDENTIQHEWDYYEDGEIKNSSTTKFTRK